MWILVIIAISSNGIDMDHIEFSSEKTCNIAKREVYLKTEVRDTVCVKK